MKVIGLTGGIGSGKSTVARLLKKLGMVVIDTDKVGHQILSSDAGAKQEVVAAFGEEVLDPGGGINREKLGRMVFGNPRSLLRLNMITHPRIAGRVKAQLELHLKEGVELVVIEAPLLIEAGWASMVDEVWVTVSSEDNVLKRLKERAGLSEAESIKRIRSQTSVAERVRQADVVIDNDGDLSELEEKVAEIWRGLDSRPV